MNYHKQQQHQVRGATTMAHIADNKNNNHNTIDNNDNDTEDDDDDCSSTSTDSDFFSPFASYRKTKVTRQSETLPLDSNNSWIGARQSPIREIISQDEEAQQKQQQPQRNQHKQQHQTQKQNINLDEEEEEANFATERSSLLSSSSSSLSSFGRKTIATSTNNNENNNSNPRNRTLPSGSHLRRGASGRNGQLSIWDEPDIGNETDTTELHANRYSHLSSQPQSPAVHSSPASCNNCWNIVVYISGFHMASIAIHDAYLWYISYRLGRQTNVQAWTLPWLSPPLAIMQRFGGLVPSRIFIFMATSSSSMATTPEWWRCLTSSVICGSVLEWTICVWAWQTRLLSSYKTPPSRAWIGIYVVSVLTGQLWMFAFESSGVSGCASWGLAGILCAVGGAKPHYRFSMFMTVICLVVLALLQPTNSVMGMIGGAFFGWAYYGLGWSRVVSQKDRETVSQPRGMVRLLSFITILKLWVVPTLCVALRQEPTVEYYHYSR